VCRPREDWNGYINCKSRTFTYNKVSPKFVHDCDKCVYLGTESLEYQGDGEFVE